MGTKSHSIKRLRTEIAEVSKEIDKRLTRLDNISIEIKEEHCYKELKTILFDMQTLAEGKFRQSLLSSGEEVWHFAWDSVWDAVKELEIKAIPETKNNYKKLEPALRARQHSLKLQLQVAEMMSDRVWNEIWNAVWTVVRGLNDEFRATETTEFKQVEEELQPLLSKKSGLQSELKELLKSENRLYSFLKRLTKSIRKGP